MRSITGFVLESFVETDEIGTGNSLGSGAEVLAFFQFETSTTYCPLSVELGQEMRVKLTDDNGTPEATVCVGTGIRVCLSLDCAPISAGGE
jgi:hypothetical protein